MKFTLNPFIQTLVTVFAITGLFYVLGGPGPVTQIPEIILNLNQKVYVAVEGEGKISVIDTLSSTVAKNIDLGGFSPHNVQVSPDNNTVWVTGNAGTHAHSLRLISSANADEGHDDTGLDQVIVIDPVSDKIIQRIGIKAGIHLAHVVLTPDSRFAYVTAQTEGVIYKIDAKTYKIARQITARVGSEPHGLRISPDGKYAYIAMLKGRSLGVIDLASDNLTEIPLNGAAVQSGITPDNKYAVASLYDTKQLAVYNIASGNVSFVNLPDGAKGPVQMYPTPDSKFIYLADQGYYFGEPTSEWVYKIDINAGMVTKEIKAGKAPHGVVVSGDGKFVYVTNLLSNDVSVIDAISDSEIKRINVGKEPNGISIWYKK